VSAELLSKIQSTGTQAIEGSTRPRTRLWGNGVDAVPYRQAQGRPLPLFKSDDSPQNKPKEVWDTKACVFHLADDADLLQYNTVMQMIGRGRAMHSFERVEWDSEAKNFVVFLRWVELFMEMPT